MSRFVTPGAEFTVYLLQIEMFVSAAVAALASAPYLRLPCYTNPNCKYSERYTSMSKYISELMSPQLMGVVYAFVGFIIALYVLSVVYVFIDARRRGASAYVAWGIIALIPFVGLIAYLVLRPHSYASDREEQELDMALRERQLAQYGTCPQCGAPIEKDFVVCPVCDTQVRNVCPSCHRPLDAHWKVCPYCRTRIQ